MSFNGLSFTNCKIANIINRIVLVTIPKQGNLEESGEISPWMWGGGGAGGVGGSSDKLDDGGGLEVEYMDLDEFLLENELPITSLFDEQSNHATGGVPQPGQSPFSFSIKSSHLFCY